MAPGAVDEVPGAVDEVVVGGRVAWLDAGRLDAGRLAGQVFAAVTVAPALLAVAWLVPGTGLLLAGRLLALPMVILFVPLAASGCYFAMRRLPERWAGMGGATGAAESGGGPGAGALWGALLLMVAIAAGFGVWQALLRSEPLFTGGGPAVYLQYGNWIAGHGTVRVPETAAAFGGAGGLKFAVTGFTAAGGSVTPAALPGVPLVLAGGAWLGGLSGALLMPAVLGGCAVLSFGGLVGRLCGAWQAVAAELALALCLPEVHAARAPFGEPLVQVLLLGGLCLFIDALEVRSSPDGGRVLAGLGGVALGLTVLVSAASFGVLLPLIPVVTLMLVARQPAGPPLGLGLLAGAGAGVAAGRVLAPAYLAGFSAAHGRLLDLCVGGFCVAAGLAVPLVLPGPRARVRRVCLFNVRVPWFGGSPVVLPSLGGVAEWLALVLPAVVLIGLAERPFVRFLGGQLDGLRHYQQFGVYWAAWYLGVPALLLSAAGAAAFGQRAVRAMLDGGAFAAGSALRLWGLPLLVVFWSSVTVLWDPFVAPWQPAASRRLVPVVLPGLVLLAVWALSWLAARAAALGASRRVVAGVAACCVLAVAVPPAVTTLGPSVTRADPTGPGASGPDTAWIMRLNGPGASATYRGSVAAAAALCAAIGPSASVLFTDRATAAMYAPTVRGLCGKPAALLGTGGSGVAQAARAIEQAGRRPVLLGPTRASVSLPGALPGAAGQQAVSLRTAADARTLAGAPTGNGTVTYSLWLAAPMQVGPV